MNRLIPISGLLAAVSGAAWLIPAIAASAERGGLIGKEYMIAAIGPLLILGGFVAIGCGFRELRSLKVPPPVRAAILCNGLFVAFCLLELSDRFLRQNGRLFYWTSILVLPALGLFYGQVLAQRWAWWTARIVTAMLTLWFAGFLLVIPFAHLHGKGGAAPWWGKIYVTVVTLVFATVSACAFRSLGRAEARGFYGIPKKT